MRGWVLIEVQPRRRVGPLVRGLRRGVAASRREQNNCRHISRSQRNAERWARGKADGLLPIRFKFTFCSSPPPPPAREKRERKIKDPNREDCLPFVSTPPPCHQTRPEKHRGPVALAPPRSPPPLSPISAHSAWCSPLQFKPFDRDRRRTTSRLSTAGVPLFLPFLFFAFLRLEQLCVWGALGWCLSGVFNPTHQLPAVSQPLPTPVTRVGAVDSVECDRLGNRSRRGWFIPRCLYTM